MPKRSPAEIAIGPLAPSAIAHGGVAQQSPDLALKASNASLPRIVLNDVSERVIGDFNLARLETIGLHLSSNKIAARDLQLLARRVAGETDDLHAVAKRPGDRVEHIRRRDEHDAAEVKRHAQVIVAKGVVLLGIKHFQERGGRVALNAGAELVDLIQHHDAVAGLGLADPLNDVAGQGADIGSSMSANLRLVMHPAEADAHKFAVHGARDRLAERRLADAGRSDKAKDRRLAARRQLANGQIFDDPALDLLETEVILVKDAARRRDVDRRLLGKAPGQFDQPIEIGSHHPVLAGGFRHALQTPELLARLVVDLLGHFRVADRLLKLGDLG